jgi:hypothetical protein
VNARDRTASADLSYVRWIASIFARAGNKAVVEMGNVDALATLKITGDKLAEVLEENNEAIQSMIRALGG